MLVSAQRLDQWERQKRDIIVWAAKDFAQRGLGVEDCIAFLKREYRFNPDRRLVRGFLFHEWRRLRGGR